MRTWPLVLLLAFTPVSQVPARSLPKVLFLTYSAGFHHDVVRRARPDKLSLAEEQLIASTQGLVDIVATQDCEAVTAEKLKEYAGVVFYTTGEPAIDKEALVEFVRRGGGFVGIHCAADTLYKFPAYREMIGGVFNGHPWHKKVRVNVEDRRHPSTAHLGPSFEIMDEIYQFADWDRGKAHVLMSLDKSTVDAGLGKRADGDYALAWTKSFGKGRVFYTALGHGANVWKEPDFIRHVVGGLNWSLGLKEPVDDAGFESIPFDNGWVQAGPGKFTVENGVATSSGGMGLWYYARRQFRNFVLKLEFKQNKLGANSGVFVRFPRVDGNPWNPVREGYEIQIMGNKPSKDTTASVYSFKAAESVPIRPAGEWNEYEIACVGQTYTICLNGRKVNTFVGARSETGMFGLQNHDSWSVVSFRNVRVLELPDSATAYHVLFDGSEPKRWKHCGGGAIDPVDGALATHGGYGLLWHDEEFYDFILTVQWQVSRKEDNSGVLVRFPDPGTNPWIASTKGHEVQISDLDPPKHRTGSIYAFQDATHIPTGEVGAWNTMEVTVTRLNYRVRINGELVNEFASKRSESGHIGLQNHDPASHVRFRDIRLIELHRSW